MRRRREPVELTLRHLGAGDAPARGPPRQFGHFSPHGPCVEDAQDVLGSPRERREPGAKALHELGGLPGWSVPLLGALRMKLGALRMKPWPARVRGHATA